MSRIRLHSRHHIQGMPLWLEKKDSYEQFRSYLASCHNVQPIQLCTLFYQEPIRRGKSHHLLYVFMPPAISTINLVKLENGMEVLEAIQSVNLYQQNNNLFRGLAFIIGVAVDVNVDSVQILKVPGVGFNNGSLLLHGSPPLKNFMASPPLGTSRYLKHDIIHCPLCTHLFMNK